MKLTILITCFNEKLTILKAIEQAKAIDMDKEIIVIDNCSTDGTKEILGELGNNKTLKIIIHSRNMGAGYSTSEGISLAKGDYFYGPGADLEYNMNDVYGMMERIESENLDVVLGSRLSDRIGISKIQLIRERPYWLGTIIATFLINILYGRSFTDVIGINLIKTKILKTMGCKANSQAFTFELVGKLCKYRKKIGEVPIQYKPRTHKQGKTIRAIDMLPALWVIIKVKLFG